MICFNRAESIALFAFAVMSLLVGSVLVYHLGIRRGRNLLNERLERAGSVIRV